MLGRKSKRIKELERNNAELQQCIKNRNKLIEKLVFDNENVKKIRESIDEDLKSKDEQCFELTKEINELNKKLAKKEGK